MRSLIAALCALAMYCFAVAGAAALETQELRAAGASEHIEFSAWAGPELRVFLLRPKGAGDNAPVVFVMHGVKRDADRYFDEWRPLADRYGFVLVVPEFSEAQFKGASGYNLGGLVDESGAAGDRARSAFAAIEPLFDAVRDRYGLSTGRYVLYGHSAGAQFAHRFAMFGFGARASAVIAANAGWYTFPGTGDWPYGPHGLSAGLYDRDRALAAPLIVLAGEADTDSGHPSLRRTREADAQGASRYDRALAFYSAGAALAGERATRFGWSCVTAPGVDHDDAKAAPFAVALILHGSPPAGSPCRSGSAL